MRGPSAIFVLLLLAAGCGDQGGARETPVSNVGKAPDSLSRPGANAVTKDARAIATH